MKQSRCKRTSVTNVSVSARQTQSRQVEDQLHRGAEGCEGGQSWSEARLSAGLASPYSPRIDLAKQDYLTLLLILIIAVTARYIGTLYSYQALVARVYRKVRAN
jgi:hypothetical protein